VKRHTDAPEVPLPLPASLASKLARVA